MTETPFKAYKADVKFDPIKDSGDGLIESAEANQNKFLESLTKRNADLFKYELEHAKIKDSRIDKLAELSTTIAKGVAPIWEAHKNEKYLEGAKLWKKDLAENQEAQQIQFDIDEQQLLTEEQINNEIVDAAEENGEIDPWLKDRLKKLPRLQRYGYLKAIYSQEAKMYPLYREQNKTIPVSIKTSDGQIVNRALEDAKDPNEWNQINERLINGYIRPFASEGHKQPMLKKYLYKEMDKIEEDEFKSWSTKKIEEITNETNEKSDNTFKNDVSKNPNAVMNYALAEAGRHGGISKSHDKAIELYKELKEYIKIPLIVSGGLGSKKDLKNIKKEICPSGISFASSSHYKILKDNLKLIHKYNPSEGNLDYIKNYKKFFRGELFNINEIFKELHNYEI